MGFSDIHGSSISCLTKTNIDIVEWCVRPSMIGNLLAQLFIHLLTRLRIV